MYIHGTWSEEKRHLDAFYMKDLNELSCMDISSLSLHRKLRVVPGIWKNVLQQWALWCDLSMPAHGTANSFYLATTLRTSEFLNQKFLFEIFKSKDPL